MYTGASHLTAHDRFSDYKSIWWTPLKGVPMTIISAIICNPGGGILEEMVYTSVAESEEPHHFPCRSRIKKLIFFIFAMYKPWDRRIHYLVHITFRAGA
jgi:hypothetical protein